MNNLRKRTPLWKWILLIVFGSAFFFVLSQVAPVAGTFSNKPWIKAALLLLGGLIVLVLYTLYIKIFEKRKVSELKINRALPDLLTGFAIGTLFIVTVVGVLAIIGIYRVESIQINWVALLINFASLWIPAVCEEILFRGIIFRMIADRFNVISAFIISSFIFGFVHMVYVDLWTAIAISFEAGFMLAAAYRLRNNLWVPIGIHWAWNFMLGPIFGSSVSGSPQEYGLIIPEISGPYILTGGSNGLEGSIVTCCTGILFGIFLLYYGKRGKRG